MNWKIWLKISSIILTLFLLFWFYTSVFIIPSASQASILSWLISIVLGLIFMAVILVPIHYFAWKRKV